MGTRDSLDWCRKSSAHIGIQTPAHTECSELIYPYYEGKQGEKRYSCTLTLALDVCKWLTSCPAALIPGKKNFGTPSTEGWVGLRASLDDLKMRKIFCPY